MEKIGLGGSCHWCTEAIFQSVIGVEEVRQGWIAPDGESSAFSEAVTVAFNPSVITLETLIAIHLHTYSSTSNHGFRSKYRLAIYCFNEMQTNDAEKALKHLQAEFADRLITEVSRFGHFKLNDAVYLGYYYANPGKPFCKNMINPKLRLLLKHFSKESDMQKLRHL